MVSPAFRDSRWQRRSVAFNRGDLLFLYTDGVSDALAGPDDCGEEPIVRLLQQHANGGDGHLLDSVLASVREQVGTLPQPDDLTLLSATIR